ncbi:unnamed protein product [Bemisia tabaci]|uniref:Cuticular protein n=1 Tax=Bemisia tabaci TaxID=7038 RepID=A0A9P0F329_BEMTA|nr:unnamed protein product [Bemisia tabaci]
MQTTKTMQLFAVSVTLFVVVKAQYDFHGYGGGHHEEHHDDHHYHHPTPYGFGYGVQDHHKGLDFKQHEHSDGHKVNGEYAVLLPDGRYQIVKYEADWKNGYHADVKYYGEAKYPSHYKHEEYGHDYGHGLGEATGSAYNNLGHGHGHGHDELSGAGSGKHYVKAPQPQH